MGGTQLEDTADTAHRWRRCPACGAAASKHANMEGYPKAKRKGERREKGSLRCRWTGVRPKVCPGMGVHVSRYKPNVQVSTPSTLSSNRQSPQNNCQQQSSSPWQHRAAESQEARCTSYKPFAWEVAPLKACSLAVDWNQIVLGAAAPVPSPVVGGETSRLGGADQMAPPASSLVVSPLLEQSPGGTSNW